MALKHCLGTCLTVARSFGRKQKISYPDPGYVKLEWRQEFVSSRGQSTMTAVQRAYRVVEPQGYAVQVWPR
jgi:hypothetical protein